MPIGIFKLISLDITLELNYLTPKKYQETISQNKHDITNDRSLITYCHYLNIRDQHRHRKRFIRYVNPISMYVYVSAQKINVNLNSKSPFRDNWPKLKLPSLDCGSSNCLQRIHWDVSLVKIVRKEKNVVNPWCRHESFFRIQLKSSLIYECFVTHGLSRARLSGWSFGKPWASPNKAPSYTVQWQQCVKHWS